jgi:hypothetical protein
MSTKKTPDSGSGQIPRPISGQFDQASDLIRGLAGRFEIVAKQTDDSDLKWFLREQAAAAQLLKSECLNTGHSEEHSAKAVRSGLNKMATEFAVRGQDKFADDVTAVMNEYFPAPKTEPAKPRKTVRVKKAAPATAATVQVVPTPPPPPAPAAAAAPPQKRGFMLAAGEIDKNLDLSMTKGLGAEEAKYAAVHTVSPEMQTLDKILGRVEDKFNTVGSGSNSGEAVSFCAEQVAVIGKLRLTVRQSGQGTASAAKSSVITKLHDIDDLLKAKAKAGMSEAADVTKTVQTAIGVLEGRIVPKKEQEKGSKPASAPPPSPSSPGN